MSNQLDLYLQSLNKQNEYFKEFEETDFFYTPSSQNETQQSIPNSISYVSKQSPMEQNQTYDKISLSELRQDEEFQERASRFLEGVGANEDIFEYLRDADFSLSSAIVRSFQTGNWTEQQKEDYTYLKNRFDNPDIETWTERFNQVKDIGIDIVADPLNIVAAFGALLTGGTSLVGSTALKSALANTAKQGIKRLTTSKLKTEATKKSALFGAAEGAAWGGLHNYFLQDIDLNLGARENLDFTNLSSSTLLGAGFGGLIGGFTKRMRFNKQIKEAQEELAKRADDSLDNTPVTDMPDEHTKLADKFSDENAIDEAGKNATRKEIEEEANIFNMFSEYASKGGGQKLLYKIIARTFGKSTTAYLSYINKSADMRDILSKFRYDYDTKVLEKRKLGVRGETYGEMRDRLTGKYISDSLLSLSGLTRVGGRNALNPEKSQKLLQLLRDEKIVARQDKATKNKIWIKDLLDAGQVDKDIAIAYGGKIEKNGTISFDGTLGLRNVLDDAFEDGLSEEIFKPFTQFRTGFFPRVFNYTKLQDKANRKRFKKILIQSGHADPINEVPTQQFIDSVTNQKRKGVLAEAKGKDSEIFGIDFLKEANGNKEKAKSLKADRIINDMLSLKGMPEDVMLVKQGKIKSDRVGFLQARRFTNIKDNDIAFLLEDDLEPLLYDYFQNLSVAQARKNKFGTEADFSKKLDKVRTQLKEAGVSDEEALSVSEDLFNLYRRTTGIDTPSIKNQGLRNLADGLLVSQQMAHLPLATVSSLTEPLILLSRINELDEVPEVLKIIAKSIASEKNNVFEKTSNFLKRTRGKETKGTSDLLDEEWFEMYQTGLGLEMATFEIIEGLSGAVAQRGGTAETIQRGFFKANLLAQWTKAVQLASYTTGKRLIKKNAQKLYEDSLKTKTIKTGTSKTTVTRGKALSANKKRMYILQLNELGIDEKDAINWYKGSLKDGVFDETLSKKLLIDIDGVKQNFYHTRLSRGANRFVKEIILQPSTAQANRPLWFSEPASQLLIQFAGYPAVFSNTVLKRFINEAFVTAPSENIGKIAGTALLMTAVAHTTNTIRSGGKNLKEYGTDEDKSEFALVGDAVRRWGGLGPFDYVTKFTNEFNTKAGPVAQFARAVGGPIPQDVIDAISYRRGLPEIIVTNLPGYGLLPSETRKELRRVARGTAKKTKSAGLPDYYFNTKRGYARGGIVLNVPNVKDEPDEMISRVTKQPFNESSESVQDVEDRELKAQMKSLGL